MPEACGVVMQEWQGAAGEGASSSSGWRSPVWEVSAPAPPPGSTPTEPCPLAHPERGC